ncbi:putative ww rsp5 wwp [Rosellinia necatrix]|uniref:Putative ww rsp5 wwp n=1 Tax=Rosellinia necatrix TaxID=77044 RepID=A0A1W2TXF3_ROSNE|nr:putative ww rsp5 wwp [Rosellinia necatrix]
MGIDFPPGWSSERLSTLSLDEYSQLPEQERASLRAVVRKHPFSSEYPKLMKLHSALSSAAARPATPPSYVPLGWTVEQARGFDMSLVSKLSEEENRLRVAGICADSARRDLKAGQQAAEPPSYVPAGWTAAQAISPTFGILSQLSLQELTRFMESRNEQKASQIRSLAINSARPSSNAHLLPSPLVQTLQREGYPAWGFVLVRTYYASEERWGAFQGRLDILCDAQLNEEEGEGQQSIKDRLEFNTIEDPRLQGISHAEARKHFHIARAMGGVAAGLDLSVLLLVDEDVIDSFLGNGARSSPGEPASPHLVAVDVAEPPADQVARGYPGFFRVSVNALLSELYPKLRMGLSGEDLWAMLDGGQTLWIGDDE